MRHSIKCKKKTKTDYTKQICSRVESGGEITSLIYIQIIVFDLPEFPEILITVS